MGNVSTFSRVFVLIAISLILMISCGDKGPTSATDEPTKGDIEGQVITSDSEEGIDNALVILSAKNFTNQEAYTEDGKFQFSNLDHGEYQLTVRLPQGYSEDDELERQIIVDGNKNIQIRAKPVRVQTATIEKGTIDTLATSSGVYLTINASESEADVELHIEETDKLAFSGQETLSNPVQIRLGSNNGASASASLQAQLRSSSTSDTKITMSILQAYSGNTDEAMFTFQFDDEDPVFAYAEGKPKEYLDSSVNQETDVMAHEFTLSSEAELRLSAALTRIDRTCDDSEISQGYRSLEELDGVLEGEKPLILIHGIQLEKAECEGFIDYYPELELFEPLIEELREDDDIRSNYKLYTYRYTSNTPVLENSDALWDMMQSEGVEEPVIIAHSMGGLVSRGLMLTEGEDKVAGLITLGTPHEGSPIADLAFATNNVINTLGCSGVVMNIVCGMNNLNMHLIPQTEGLEDLRPNADLINNLLTLEGDDQKIFTIGGALRPNLDWEAFQGRINDPLSTLVYEIGYNYMGRGVNPNDGMVPLESAIPDWSTLSAVLDNHNHSEIARGINNNASSVFEDVRPVLLQFVSIITLPQLVTKNVTDITSESAVSGGQISNDGGAAITARGVCWSTSEDPTIEDNCTSDGSGMGNYESEMNDLSSNTTYYVRAYAQNEVGTGYGNEKSFTTETESDYDHIKNGLDSYWTFDSWSDQISENSVNSNDHFELQNNPKFIDGKINTGISLDGSDKEEAISNYISSSLPLTYHFWTYHDGSNETTSYFVDGTGGSYKGVYVYRANDSNKVSVRIAGDNGFCSPSGRRNYFSSNQLSLNEWNHVVIIIKSISDVEIYINNQAGSEYLSGTASSANIGSGEHFSLGSSWSCSSRAKRFYDTKSIIDELGIWSRELKVDEINTLYNDGNGLSLF